VACNIIIRTTLFTPGIILNMELPLHRILLTLIWNLCEEAGTVYMELQYCLNAGIICHTFVCTARAHIYWNNQVVHGLAP
jgi:hypothetical protein